MVEMVRAALIILLMAVAARADQFSGALLRGVYIAAPTSTLNVTNYGASGDAVNFTASTTNASGAVTVTSTNVFSSADTGKIVELFGVGTATSGGHFQDYVGTVVSVSGSSLTLTPALGRTLTGVSGVLGTNNAGPFAAAVAACATTADTITIPAGRYLIVSGAMLTNYTMTGATDAKPAVVLRRGGIRFHGAGTNATTLLNCGAWLLRGSFVQRGTMFFCQGPVTNNYPLQFDNLTLDGGVSAAFESNHNFPSSVVDGSGWDETHHAVMDTGSASLHTSKVFDTCRIVHWKGESLISTVPNTDGYNTITSCWFEDNNASGINFSFSHTVSGCTFTNANFAEEFYEGYSTQASLWTNNLVTNCVAGMALVGAETNHTSQAFMFANNTMSATNYLFLISPAQHVTMTGNKFFDATIGLETDTASMQGSAFNYDWTITANTFSNVFLPFVFSGVYTDRLDTAVLSNNVAAGNSSSFISGSGFLTNVSVLASTGQSPIDASTMTGQYPLDDTSNVIPYYSDPVNAAITNVISYGHGLRHQIVSNTAVCIWVLDDSLPAKVPPGAQLWVTNSATTNATVFLSKVNYPACASNVVTKGGALMQVYWSGSAWTNAPVFESETLAYGTAITNNSGTISAANFVAVDTFVKAAKANGYWSYLTDASPLAGNQTNASSIKLIQHANSALSGNKINLYGGLAATDYAPTSGWTLSGGKFMWPGLSMSNTMFAPNTNGAAVWVSGFTTNSRGWLFGSYNTGSLEAQFAAWGYQLVAFQTLGVFGGDADTSPNINNSEVAIDEGLWSISRNSSSSASVFVNSQNAATISGTVNTTHPNTAFMWLLGGRSASTTLPPILDTLNGSYKVGWYGVDSGIPYSMQTNYYNDVKTLMRSLGRLATRSARRLCFVVTGQSNAQGAGATGTPGNSIYTNLIGNASAWFYASAGMTNHLRQRAISAEATVYCGWMAMQEQLSAMARAGGHSTNYDSLVETFGVNGATLGSLYKGGATPAYIDSTNWAAQQNVVEVDKYGTTLQFPAIFSVQGESDAGVTNYGSVLTNFQHGYETDLNAINGDSAAIPVLCTQIPTYTSNTVGVQYVNDQMLTLQETNASKVVLVGPRYQYPYGSDHIHLTQLGYELMGELYGRAMFNLLSTGAYTPLRPTNIVLSAGTNLTVSFTGYEGTLVLDTNSFAWLTQTNYGFSYSDGSGGATINTVALVSSNQVKLTLNTDITAHTARFLQYAQNSSTNNNGAGTTAGPGGNLRDASATVGVISGSNVWNWCVGFNKSF